MALSGLVKSGDERPVLVILQRALAAQYQRHLAILFSHYSAADDQPILVSVVEHEVWLLSPFCNADKVLRGPGAGCINPLHDQVGRERSGRGNSIFDLWLVSKRQRSIGTSGDTLLPSSAIASDGRRLDGLLELSLSGGICNAVGNLIEVARSFGLWREPAHLGSIILGSVKLHVYLSTGKRLHLIRAVNLSASIDTMRQADPLRWEEGSGDTQSRSVSILRR
jgi:hypothetical protein